jgi:hypothetical protein
LSSGTAGPTRLAEAIGYLTNHWDALPLDAIDSRLSTGNNQTNRNESFALISVRRRPLLRLESRGFATAFPICEGNRQWKPAIAEDKLRQRPRCRQVDQVSG